jgi:hypothetical protein
LRASVFSLDLKDQLPLLKQGLPRNTSEQDVRRGLEADAEIKSEERSLDCAARLRFAKEGKSARGSARDDSALKEVVRNNLESRS